MSSRPRTRTLSLGALAWISLTSTGCFVTDADLASKLDNDGDNVPLGEDCAPNDPAFSKVVEWYGDVDGDGFGAGDLVVGCESARPTTNTADISGDCDDSNPSAHPGAEERYYDGVDQDCAGEDADGNGTVDDYDQDSDGFTIDEDCDDTDPTLKPDDSLAEVPYDGIDNDCNLTTGDGDKDGDGFWSTDYADKAPSSELLPPVGFDGDCYDDPDAPEQTVSSHNGLPSPDPATVYPGSAAEIPYDGVDSACDGDALEFDADGDGYLSGSYPNRSGQTGTDCQDCTTPCSAEAEWSGDVDSEDIHPDADETWYDGVDQDCGTVDVNRDGVEDDYDADFDSHVALGYTDRYGVVGSDCVDTNEEVYPGASDVWYDGVDSDCGQEDDFDADSDGYVPNAYFGATTEGLPPGAPVLDPGDCVDDPSADATATGPRARASDYNPGSTDTWYDGFDHDCAGNDDYDLDADGYRSSAYASASDLGTAQQLTVIIASGAAPATDCDDTDATVNPGGSEIPSNGVDDDCDGAAAPEGIRGENYTGTDASGTILGANANGSGSRMAVGDLNDDGVADIVTGDLYYSDRDDYMGQVHWYDGADVLNQTIDEEDYVARYEGASAYEFLGAALLVDDVNGDGYNDLVAGAHGYTNFGGYDGAVYVMAGVLSGSSSSSSSDQAISVADQMVVGLLGDGVGFSLGAADNTGDGRAELIIGAPYADLASSNSGAVYAVDLSSGSSEIRVEDYPVLVGGEEYDYIGLSDTISTGDYNGDGLDDVVVGSYYSRREATYGGVAFVVETPFIDSAHFEDVALTEFSSTGSYDYCGSSTAVGDLNGDGFDDIAVSCPYYASTIGFVGLIYGASSPSSEVNLYSANLIFEGDASVGSELGASVDFVDLDADGQLDLVIGEPSASVSSSSSSEGRVAFFDGAGLSTGYHSSGSADGFVIGAQSGSDAGEVVMGAPDMDGDGDPELVIHSRGWNSGFTGYGEVSIFTGGEW